MSPEGRAAAWIAGRNRWSVAAICLGTGALAALGQAPFDLWYLALFGFAGIVALVTVSETARQAGLRAWLAGGGYFALALSWIVEPFLIDVPRHGWMAPFALVLMAAGMALFWAVAGWLSLRLRGRARGPAVAGLLFALILTGAEALRGAILTGFPWVHPGHIWIDTAALGLAAYGGPHALTLLTLLLAVALMAAVLRRPRSALVLALPPLAAIAAGASLPPAPPPGPDAPVIRIVQPNAPQHLKWDPDWVGVFFERAVELSRGGSVAPGSDGPDTQADLVIWPETSLPPLLDRSEAWRERIVEATAPTPVILGAQRIEDGRARNSLVVLDGAGAVTDIYDKHHLVPFGEYMPLGGLADRLGLQAIAAILNTGYATGPGPRLLDLGGTLGTAFPMICYETIFAGYIRQTARPDWMVQITNDAWFGAVSGPYQHLALARLRAAEQGLPLIRAANTGVSAVIDARGRILAALPLGEHGALQTALPPALPPTIYARLGDWPVFFMVFATLAVILASGRQKAH